jgi:maltose O-acetyltransferase
MAPASTARLARWSARISATPPLELESLVRSLLVHYFFHVSNREIVEVIGLAPGQRPTLNLVSPVQIRGSGRVRIDASAVLGWARSPFSHRSSYLEARQPGACVEIGAGTTLNNAFSLIAEGAGIRLGARCLVGTEFQALDTNAHELELGRRHLPDSRTAPVEIGDDVFIGSRVTILKGCRVGAGCVIAAGSVLAPGFVAPALSIVAGNPARVVGRVPGSGTDSAAAGLAA